MTKTKRDLIEEIIDDKTREIIILEINKIMIEKAEKANKAKPILVPSMALDKKGNPMNTQRQMFPQEQIKEIERLIATREFELSAIRDYLNMV